MAKIQQLPIADGPIPKPGQKDRRRRWLLALSVVLGLVAVLLVVAATIEFTIAEVPDPESGVLNPVRLPHPQGDLWGRKIWAHPGSEVPGLVAIDQEVLRLGRKAFYDETFGNQVFFHDIIGITSGPLGLTDFMQAIMALNGEATTNLRVRLKEDADIGGRHFIAGTMIDTGLDVPAESLAPLGMAIRYRSFGIKVGVSCALCHATVDPDTGLVVEGASNQDLNVGLLLAMAPNTAAFFTHTDIRDVVAGLEGKGWSDLPGQAEVERAVDEVLLLWPPGTFDSTIDFAANPTRFPHAFTAEGHPFGWSGMGQVGPFKGLSAFVNNVHAQNTDSLSQVALSETLFEIGPERYLALILRGAQGKFRFDPKGGLSPSAHLAQVDPTPQRPGLNAVLMPSTYPLVTPVALDGVQLGLPGRRAWEVTNAIAAFQDTLLAPVLPDRADLEVIAHGRKVFAQAGCTDCHVGPAATDHRVIPIEEIGTEASRAKALAKTREIFTLQAQLIAFDQVVGEADRPLREITAPVDAAMTASLERAFAHDGKGGYRTTALVAMPWQAPYLHDGGVAVGPGGELGITGTLLAGIPVDPAASLRALIDRELRAEVVAANRSDRFRWMRLNVRGVGHGYWIDSLTGFDREDQDALIAFLLARRYEPAAESDDDDAGPPEPSAGVAWSGDRAADDR